ncbi:hypothetical protein [Nocardioides pocheonensis]|uniref:CU044_5270 family protein n=1 Tax=Nocardioides pocheonensis TaxID=661485 RepID=A0A3N0H008_9ACTN|nr:hypothetical protein [Nocardioides pocheonensis]RNM17740.1 hypothetical protein EFL26_00260 [Nocardioides pocheonensis]
MIDELVRDARPDVTAPDPTVVLRARRALLRKALVRRARRRFAVRTAIGLSAAAVIVAATVVAQTPDHGASAAAAAILENSADALEAGRPPLPGQYVYRKEVTLSWDYGPSPTDPSQEDTAPRTSPVLVETWVPTDPDKPLIQRTQDSTNPVSWAVVDQSANANDSIYRDRPKGAAMLDALRELARRSGSDFTDDLSAVWSAAFWLLSDPQSPDAVNAEVLRAVARVDGVKVVDEHAEIDGRTGVALGIDERYAVDFVFDPADGAFLGMRGHPAHTKNWVGPDEPIWTTTFESRVVSSAPRPPDDLRQ